jgi:hypothetical protein
MKIIGIAVLMAVALVHAPAVAQEVTPVVATDEQMQLFAGVWRGHVESDDPRFAGEVELRFGREGAVVIRSHSEPSRILWLRLTSRGMSGALQPYFDRARGSEVYTTFEATRADGTLNGVLRERVHMQWWETARWTARRVEK